MAPGRSPADAVWRQTARGDLAVSLDEHVLSWLADLKQCYERVRRDRLLTSAVERHFLIHALRFYPG